MNASCRRSKPRITMRSSPTTPSSGACRRVATARLTRMIHVYRRASNSLRRRHPSPAPPRISGLASRRGLPEKKGVIKRLTAVAPSPAEDRLIALADEDKFGQLPVFIADAGRCKGLGSEGGPRPIQRVNSLHHSGGTTIPSRESGESRQQE